MVGPAARLLLFTQLRRSSRLSAQYSSYSSSYSSAQKHWSGNGIRTSSTINILAELICPFSCSLALNTFKNDILYASQHNAYLHTAFNAVESPSIQRESMGLALPGALCNRVFHDHALCYLTEFIEMFTQSLWKSKATKAVRSIGRCQRFHLALEQDKEKSTQRQTDTERGLNCSDNSAIFIMECQQWNVSMYWISVTRRRHLRRKSNQY